MKRRIPLTVKWYLNEAVWTTEDGKELYSKDFEDEHLMNTICYLANRAEELIEYEDNEDLIIDDCQYWLAQKPIFKALVDEALERGLIELELARAAHWTLR